VRAGDDAGAIADRPLSGFGSREWYRTQPCFHCNCDRDRIQRAVLLLGRDAIQEMAEADGSLELRCEFCRQIYRLSADEVGTLFLDG
jgi:molecular chaperone Hsp33